MAEDFSDKNNLDIDLKQMELKAAPGYYFISGYTNINVIQTDWIVALMGFLSSNFPAASTCQNGLISLPSSAD